MRSNPLTVLLLLGLALALGCGSRDAEQVVLYTSLNEPTARAVIEEFERRTGVRVVVQADTERDKTVGLVQTLIEERNRPRADVFWNSEAANMERLKAAGVLDRPDAPPANAAAIPREFSDPDGQWWGFAARARVLIVNTDLVGEDELPDSIHDLADPRWRGRAAMARPVTGTTLTHMAALAESLGEDALEDFLAAIESNDVRYPPGNGRVARLVGEGAIAFGLTDCSDYRLVRAEGAPVIAVYPDQDGMGTLLIPNTVGIVRGGPNPGNAMLLADFLLSEDAEQILAFHQRGHIPLKPGVARPDGVAEAASLRTLPADFRAIGGSLEDRLAELDRRFP